MASAGWFLLLSVAFLGLESRLARGGDERGTPVAFNAGMSTGSWPDSVKIEVPPAPSGSAPEVALVASHHVTRGPLGSGWTLSAGSVIERRSLYGGVPNFRSDVYYLDGVEMIIDNVGPSFIWSPMTIDGSVLTYNSSNNTWTRKNKGKTWTYGSTSGTNATRLLTDNGVVPLPSGGNCVTSLCKTSAWFVSKIVDPHGNTSTYTYENPTIPTGTLATRYPWATSGQYLLKTITYGAGALSVNFTYKDRPDTRFVVEGGRKTLQLKRLRGITTKTSATSTFSRYTIQYEDEVSESELVSGTHCLGLGSSGATPEQSLVRMIVQIGTGTAAAPLPQRALRCIESNHEDLAWESTAEVISTITAPAAGTNASEESVLPITANLNRDALTDLVVIGLKTDSTNGNLTSNIRVYIATPTIPVTAQSGGPQGAAALLWQHKLQLRLNNSFLQKRNAWALVDWDGDLTPELFWEDTGGVIKMDYLSNDALTFSTTSTGFTTCELKYGSFANIDGNKYIDLVVHPSCYNGTTWMRDLNSRVSLPVPLDANTEWNNILSGACASTGGTVTPPGSFNPDWTAAYPAQYYIGDHARFGDFNGDGLADIAYALHACWQETTTDDLSTKDFNESNWEPLLGSTYSRIWFGDGYGKFTDSELSAGPPVTFDLDTVDTTNSPSVAHENRTLSGMLAPIDLDNNGLPELLTSAVFSEGAGTIASKYRGLVSGLVGKLGAQCLSAGYRHRDRGPSLGHGDSGDGVLRRRSPLPSP